MDPAEDPNTIRPGASMPVDPEKVEVVEAPEPVVTPNTKDNSMAPLQYVDNIEHYSRSELLKTKHRHKVILVELIVAFTLFAGIILGVFLGPGLYKSVAGNPNDTFDDMLLNIMGVQTEFHNVVSTTSAGVLSSNYDRESKSFYNPNTKATTDIDLITNGLNIDAQVDTISTNPTAATLNIRNLSISRLIQPYGDELIDLVKNKWVSVENDYSFDDDGIVLELLEPSYRFNRPERVLPIGYIDESMRLQVYQQLNNFEPYQAECQDITSAGVELVECDVVVDPSKLRTFYSYLSQKLSATELSVNDWLESFTLYIDKESALPTELRIINSDTDTYRDIMSFEVNPITITEPLGALTIEEFKQFSSQLEAEIRQ